MVAQQQQADARGRVPAERIRARAHEIYESRNGRQGDAVSDWLQAERELEAALERASPLPEPSAAACFRRTACERSLT